MASMNPEDIIKYKSLYLQTSWGYLNMLMKNVAFLMNGPQTEPIIDGSYLAAHSLKSQSALMGYEQIGKISGIVEQILKLTKEKTLELNQEKLEIILNGLRKVQLSLTQIAENKDEAEMSDEIKNLETLLK
ncbi:MAG TPA: Hpt domain-containing protein [Candidatus Limnocylindrales bacterium]|nr:Hpt domain-containing protein [Candidatus Limnocylindrales bacterium]